DPLCLGQAVRRIVRLAGDSGVQPMLGPAIFSFAGMSFQSERNALIADGGASLELTHLEGRLLAHFLSRPWTLCSRAKIHQLVYGRNNAAGSRALDAVINRLRKKLSRLARPSAPSIIKT